MWFILSDFKILMQVVGLVWGLLMASAATSWADDDAVAKAEAGTPGGCETYAASVERAAVLGVADLGAGGNNTGGAEATVDHRPLTHSEIVAAALGKPSARSIDFAKSAQQGELSTAAGVSYVAAHCGR